MKRKAISYSLFGYNKEREANCFDFLSYLRGLMVNIRMNRLLFPDWEVVLHLDQSTYDGFAEFFEALPIRTVICDNAPLCKAMLWRLKPCVEYLDGIHRYDYVLCRDLDSPATHREAQAVQDWINKGTACHAITDSVSHNLPLLGGMIGFVPKNFTDRFHPSWEQVVGHGYDYSKKGSDQTFLNQVIYPQFGSKGSESITQHYVLGMANTFLDGFQTFIPDLDLGLNEYRDSNDVCGHIGSAGYYNTTMTKFINKHEDKFLDLIEIEKQHSDIFTWVINKMY